jgi:hypothetical protein
MPKATTKPGSIGNHFECAGFGGAQGFSLFPMKIGIGVPIFRKGRLTWFGIAHSCVRT